jgi:2-polyprenyl-6-methoxyphenol hydroxylase-like FAD-dependent oxidoreductase
VDEALEGDTYPGISLAADVRLRGPLPRDAFSLVAGPRGFVLLAPLPDDRWITFFGYLDERDGARLAAGVGADDVARLLAERLVDQVHLLEVAWASVFRAQRRIAPRLAGPRCFLVGDAGPVGSPFGGEGLNAGLHDGPTSPGSSP